MISLGSHNTNFSRDYLDVLVREFQTYSRVFTPWGGGAEERSNTDVFLGEFLLPLFLLCEFLSDFF